MVVYIYYSCLLHVIIQSLGSALPVEEAFRRLTSRDPKRFWTSGQWMTERKGGSDVGKTLREASLCYSFKSCSWLYTGEAESQLNRCGKLLIMKLSDTMHFILHVQYSKTYLVSGYERSERPVKFFCLSERTLKRSLYPQLVGQRRWLGRKLTEPTSSEASSGSRLPPMQI